MPLAADSKDRMEARILLAEDNLANRAVMLCMLRKLGLQATVVVDGRAALEAILSQTYELVLLDVQMPELSGIEVVSKTREFLNPALRPWIIAVTAHAIASDRHEFLNAGFDDLLCKPLKIEELRAALSRIPSAHALAS